MNTDPTQPPRSRRARRPMRSRRCANSLMRWTGHSYRRGSRLPHGKRSLIAHAPPSRRGEAAMLSDEHLDAAIDAAMKEQE